MKTSKKLEESHLTKEERWNAVKYTTVGATLWGVVGVNWLLGVLGLPQMFTYYWVDIGLVFGGFLIIWTMMIWVGTIEDVRSEG